MRARLPIRSLAAAVPVAALALGACATPTATDEHASALTSAITSNSPCVLAPGASRCDVALSWTGAGPITCLWLDSGGLFACAGASGSAVWPWTNLTPQTFVLRSHPDWDHVTAAAPEEARATVVAVQPHGTLTTTSPCTLAAGATTCAVALTWTATDTPIACLWTGAGQLFACGSGGGTETWPYTTTMPTELVLRAHASWSTLAASDLELARATVVALAPAPPNQPPTVALVAPAADGFAGHVGEPISVRATAQDADGAVRSLALWVNGAVVATAAGASATWAWTPGASGELAVSVSATDDRGATATTPARIAIVAERGVPAIATTWGTADQYFPMEPRLMRGTFRGVSDPPTGSKLYYFSEPVAPATWYFYWPSPSTPALDRANNDIEEWQLRRGCAGGSDWIYINAYHHRSTTGPQWDVAITTQLALLDYGGRIYDVSAVCPGGVGQPYVPLNVSGQPVRIRVWGGISAQHFYWEARFSFVASVTNACWRGTGATSRPALGFSEAWWDDNGNGWALGGGALAPGGQPTGVGATMGRHAVQGQHAGYVWDLTTLTGPAWHACSEDFAPYP